ncbi:MAG: alpha/beta fold hydrolase [Planctomycetaceae bacterium]|nr:alpha/beta fold hydrolase [Planctomycetaceae bacterium]
MTTRRVLIVMRGVVLEANMLNIPIFSFEIFDVTPESQGIPLLASVGSWPGPNWVRGLVTVVGFALGLGLCLVLAVVEWGAWAMVLPGRRMGSAEPERGPGEPIEARARDGVRLAGTWHPASAPAGRTVLLLHGFADPTPLRGRIEALNRRGWDVAALDARAHGRSEGDRASFGGRESDDLRAWIDILTDRPGAPERVAVWGRSMGTAIAIRAAAEDPRIAALVLESPYLDLEDAIAAWLRQLWLPLPRPFARLIAGRARTLAGVSLTRPRSIDLAPRIAAPALIVHGSGDSLVSPADARRLATALPRAAELIEVAGAGHANVVGAGGDALLDRVASFLDGAIDR